MKIKAILITILLLLPVLTIAAPGGERIIIYPYAASIGADASPGNDFVNELRNAFEKTRGIDTIAPKFVSPATTVVLSRENDLRNWIDVHMTDAGTHIVAGNIVPLPDGMSLETSLISIKSRKVVYRTSCHVETKSDFPEAARVTSGRIALFLRGSTPPPPDGLSAAADDEHGKISLTWNPAPGKSYAIFRSPYQEGAFRLIGNSTTSGSFSDITALRGMEYRYGIAEIINEVPRDPGSTVTAHLKAPLPRGIVLSDAQKEKKVSDAKLKKERRDTRVQKHVAFLGKYYYNPVKLSLAMIMVKSYLDNGTLVALTGFTGYSVDPVERRISLSRNNGDYLVEFSNNSYFSIIDAAQKAKLPDIASLEKRLLLNSIAFCVHRGEKRITDDKGYVLHVPLYEALGLTTEYFRDYANWRSNTLMLGTKDSELKKKIREAREKGAP